MENQRAQLLERLQAANNILVTVSSNPSVDQLSAAIGLTLMLNRVGKQATAVFSGKVPSTIEFLQPEKTIERNTDSLRDFIIALDKSKADKLRYILDDCAASALVADAFALAAIAGEVEVRQEGLQRVLRRVALELRPFESIPVDEFRRVMEVNILGVWLCWTMQRLRSEFGIYGLDSGRICVAALNTKNIDYVVASLTKVL